MVDEGDVEFPFVVPLLEQFLLQFLLLIDDDEQHYVPKTVDIDRETTQKDQRWNRDMTQWTDFFRKIFAVDWRWLMFNDHVTFRMFFNL